jgi:hypothetical protein
MGHGSEFRMKPVAEHWLVDDIADPHAMEVVVFGEFDCWVSALIFSLGCSNTWPDHAGSHSQMAGLMVQGHCRASFMFDGRSTVTVG